MFTSIPQSRLLFYLFFIGLLPIVLVMYHLMSEQAALNQLKGTLEEVEQFALMHEKKQALNKTVRHFFKNADHFYIDKNIESLALLEPEIEGLTKIASQNNVVEDENIKKRLEFLTNVNRLVFSDGMVQSYPYFHETMETLVHPVEVNTMNLEELLAKIEGVEIGAFSPGPDRPQLLITEFKIEKKKVWEKSDVFVLNLKLLKREFF